MNTKRKVLNKICILIYLISLIIIFLTKYINKSFYNVSFDQLLFSIFNSEGTSISAIIYGILYVSFFSVIILLLTLYLNRLNKKYFLNKYFLNIKIKDKRYKIKLFYFNKYVMLLISIFTLYTSILYTYKTLGIDKFLKSQKQSTKLFETDYTNPKDVKITFPKRKQNLIYIFIESLETSATSIENGGIQNESYIPKLEKLAVENINFSNSDKLGGALPITGAGWTAAAMIAQTSGVNLNIPIDGNMYKGFGSFLPGATSIGDILKDNGYKNYIMMGSDANFGGRKEYFEEHGNYEIYDLYWARKQKYIDDDYYVWWGFEDSKLFEFAKKELTRISNNDEPFNFTMLTADTHFVDGYQDKKCKNKFKSKYANVHFCNDTMIYNFINWIKKQDFYQNTTIVLVGDHLTMQKNFYTNLDKDYNRSIFNVIINSRINSSNTKNRIFSSIDMYPTTLASLGVKIEGDKLGLGTNLYSNQKTIFEKYGIEYVNSELSKKSLYYNNNILKDTYYKMEEMKNNNQ